MTNQPTSLPEAAPTFTLRRNDYGRLVLRLPDGSEHAGVVPVRAFPIAAPDEGVSLVGLDGHERIWIARLDALPPAQRHLIDEELASREFVPIIQGITAVSSFSTPSTWTVKTDRGEARLVLKAEDDIRRLGVRTSLLIASSDGVQFRVPDVTALDRQSRRLLERFL